MTIDVENRNVGPIFQGHGNAGIPVATKPLRRASIALACPVCGRERRHEFLFEKNDCDILRCEECGLGRADTADFDPAAYYTREYFSGQYADGYADYIGAEDVLRREFARMVNFIRRYRPSGRLLEIGCAYGFFLHEARRYFDVAGIEISEEAAAHCRENGLNVLTGAASGDNLDRLNKMDVIVLLDVIEHLPDPVGTLTLCARKLNPGGVIVFTTGDLGSPLARWSGVSWRLMTPPQHLWFFTGKSVERLASRLGTQVEAFGHPWKIVPLSLIVFQLRRMIGLPPQQMLTGGRVGVPVNLFDAMRVVLRRTD